MNRKQLIADAKRDALTVANVFESALACPFGPERDALNARYLKLVTAWEAAYWQPLGDRTATRVTNQARKAARRA